MSAAEEELVAFAFMLDAIPARLGNSKEVLRLPALSFTPSCSATVPTAAILGTSALPGSYGGGFLRLPENVDVGG